MIPIKKNHQNSPIMTESLTDYLDYNDSKAILYSLNNMEFEEIVAFKQSLEAILMYMIKDDIVH